ncbi:hypothetical protein ACFLZ8_04550 [Planctomycetota bacterium]
MPKTIESFVKTLESEGVDAGKKAAQKIEAQAREQAQKIITDGKAQADNIIAKAKVEAGKIQSRMNSSLELATRDAIFMLREKLSQQLNVLLNRNVENILAEEETLVNILRQVIPAYSKASAEAELTAEIHLPRDLNSKLLESAVSELTNALKGSNIQVDVKNSLAKAGFEYKIEGSTVEVSSESVTALLADMIDPELQIFLEKATSIEGENG